MQGLHLPSPLIENDLDNGIRDLKKIQMPSPILDAKIIVPCHLNSIALWEKLLAP